MATTPNVTPYDDMAKRFANKEVDLANLKAMLLSGYTLDTTHTSVSTSIAAAEVAGNGWTVGGEAIANAAVSQVNANDAMLDGDDIVVTATGGDIGPFDAIVIYDATNDTPLAHYQFAADQTVPQDTPIKLVWSTAGIVTWAV